MANALWVWLPLCALFVLPFARPPLRLLHLDLAVLLAFSVSFAFFNASRSTSRSRSSIRCSPTCSRACSGSRVSRARGREPPPLRLTVPIRALGIAAVFILGVRAGLNVVGSNVIDVGYASVIGADRFGSGEPVYGNFPVDNSRGDTYGPVLYYAYVPFEALLPWSGTWDDLPAAHVAAVVFDLLTAAGLWLLGRRLRGPALGAAARLRRGRRSRSRCSWPTPTPTTASSRCSSPPRCWRSRAPALRGAVIAAAALTKFAPLVLAPLFATYARGRWPRTRGRLRRGGGARARAGGARGRPGHVLRPHARLPGRPRLPVLGLGPLRHPRPPVALAAALVLAVVVAFVPRRRDPVSVAALGAAALIALQLALEHWFYLYLVWFLPLALVALLSGRRIDSIDSAPRRSRARCG